MARLLVVDDDPPVRALLVEILIREGHTVDAAAHGREALALLAQRLYDLIVSDLKMPHLDGAGLYEEVSARWPQMLHRLLFMTGSAMLPEYAAFLARERPALLMKPWDVTALSRVVRTMLSATPDP